MQHYVIVLLCSIIIQHYPIVLSYSIIPQYYPIVNLQYYHCHSLYIHSCRRPACFKHRHKTSNCMLLCLYNLKVFFYKVVLLKTRSGDLIVMYPYERVQPLGLTSLSNNWVFLHIDMDKIQVQIQIHPEGIGLNKKNFSKITFF